MKTVTILNALVGAVGGVGGANAQIATSVALRDWPAYERAVDYGRRRARQAQRFEHALAALCDWADGPGAAQRLCGGPGRHWRYG